MDGATHGPWITLAMPCVAFLSDVAIHVLSSAEKPMAPQGLDDLQDRVAGRGGYRSRHEEHVHRVAHLELRHGHFDSVPGQDAGCQVNCGLHASTSTLIITPAPRLADARAPWERKKNVLWGRLGMIQDFGLPQRGFR